MIKKACIPLFFCLLLSGSLLFFPVLISSAYMTGSNEAGEEETEEVNVEESIEFTSSWDARDAISFNIFEDIAKAKELLEKRRSGFQVVKSVKVEKQKQGKGKKKRVKKLVKNELGDFSILLAMESVKDREIRIIKVHPKLGARSEGILIEPGKSNGVNTKFTIVQPEHHVVLAIKRPVRHGTTFKEVVYTPYSEALDIPAVRKAGLEYLKNTLDAAKRDLIKRKVRPLSSDQFIADDVSLTLAVIEHIDPLKFESGEYTTEKLIHETLVIMGTNRQDAYRYSASKAGARGLFQFIPSTYKRISRLYPQAGLKKDFIQGMEDHENAAKASFLLFDADMRVLNNGVKERMMNDPQVLGRFLASAYNCGSGKTRGAMERHGEKWCLRVPAETQIYIKKYDAVWEWLQRESQAMR